MSDPEWIDEDTKVFLKVVVMCVLVAILGAILSGCKDAKAIQAGNPGELVYTQGSVTWRLQEPPCAADDLAESLRLQGVVDAKSAVVEQSLTNGVRRLSACWGFDNEADVLVADRTSPEPGFMPREWFTKR